MLSEVGEEGIGKLQQATVTIIGAGGLGAQVAHNLAASGVGNIRVIDDDKVELSNLPRQLIYSPQDIGFSKVERLASFLNNKYEDTKVNGINARLSQDNANDLLKSQCTDLILDCSDNFMTRKLINIYSLAISRPLITAAVSKFESQILCIDHFKMPKAGCYQCVVPENADENQNCAAMGVMGSVVGIVASMQAWLAQRYFLNINFPNGVLFRFDALELQWIKANLTANSHCPVCTV